MPARREINDEEAFRYLTEAISRARSPEELFCCLAKALFSAAGSSALVEGLVKTLESRFTQLSGDPAAGAVQAALRDSEARFRSLAELGSDWYFEQDGELCFIRFDGKFPEQNRAAFAKYLGRSVWDVGMQRDGGWEDIQQLQTQRLPFRDVVHYWNLRDGTRRYFSASADPVFHDGRFVGYRGVGRDITAQKLAEEQVQHRATHDSLTGLPNRALLDALLEQALHSARRYQRKLALLFVDLDGFKAVNDQRGHETGDALLRQMAKRFRETVRASDVVVRFGGDEFVVLAQELAARDDIALVAQKLVNAAATPVRIAEQECHIGASVGIAIFPDDGTDQVLIQRADQAMYEAKRSGKNQYRFFS